MTLQKRFHRNEWITRGFFAAGLGVQLPVLVLAFSHSHGKDIQGPGRSILLWITVTGLALVGTIAAAYIGETLGMYFRKLDAEPGLKRFLVVCWGILLFNMIFLTSAYLMASASRQSITELLHFNALRWVYFLAIPITAEVGLAGFLIARHVRRTWNLDEIALQVDDLEERLAEEKKEKETLRRTAARGTKQKRVLARLDGWKTVEALITETGLTRSSTWSALRALEKKKIVTKQNDPTASNRKIFARVPAPPLPANVDT